MNVTLANVVVITSILYLHRIVFIYSLFDVWPYVHYIRFFFIWLYVVWIRLVRNGTFLHQIFLTRKLGTLSYIFFTVFSLVKNYKKTLQTERSPHCPPAIQSLVSEVQLEWRYYFSNHACSWPVNTILDILTPFGPKFTQFLLHFSSS